jgi:hypothetical protein
VRTIRLFALDVRALALFRIGCGLLLLLDMLQRSVSLRAFYSDQGCLPAWWACQNAASPWWLGVQYLNPTYGYALVLHGLTGLAALALVLGYRSRLFCAVAWVLLLSLHCRNPFILSAGDTLLRMLLLFGCFLPLDRCLSLSQPRLAAGGTPLVFHLAGACLLLQVAAAHAFASFARSGAAWWGEGDALTLLLHNPLWASGLGQGLAGPLSPWSWLLSPAIPLLELAGGVLLLSGPLGRRLGIVLLAALHGAALLCLQLGLAGWVPLMALLALWPFDLRTGSPSGGGGEESTLEELPCSPAWAVLLSVALALVIATNLGQLVAPGWAPVRALHVPAQLFRLDQSWAVFSPQPPAVWGYPRVVAQTEHGLQPLLQADPAGDRRWDRVRWRAYYQILNTPGFEAHRQRFGRWLVTSNPRLAIRELELSWVETPVGPGASAATVKELYHGVP